jgi:hypothetical protein
MENRLLKGIFLKLNVAPYPVGVINDYRVGQRKIQEEVIKTQRE